MKSTDTPMLRVLDENGKYCSMEDIFPGGWWAPASHRSSFPKETYWIIRDGKLHETVYCRFVKEE